MNLFEWITGREILAQLTRIEEKLDALGRIIVTQYSDLTVFLAHIDTETTRLGNLVAQDNAQIAALSAQVAAGTPVTQQQLDDLNTSLQAKVAALHAIGADPTNPIPPAA